MKTKKIIIVGQGVSGTLFSWFCAQHDLDFIVIDNTLVNSPSKTAAGLINPVTGRRVVTVWMDDIILPFAEKTYKEIGTQLDIEAISKMDIVDFFPNPFMKESFLKKMNQQAPYISLAKDEQYLNEYFNYEFGTGIIEPAYIVHLQQLLPAWRQHLLHQNKFIEQAFNFNNLQVSNIGVQYENITADAVIFCDGVEGSENPYFNLLPFALNKGEAIIIEAPGLPAGHIYKKSMTLVPFGEPGIFWAGTNYIWEFDNDKPTEAFRRSTEQNLNSWLKVPYKIIDHKAAVRPATVERRPFVGLHPLYKNVGILNGMGTKGCSLAPYFAWQLVQHLTQQTPIEKEADINRHARILSRSQL